MTVKLTPQMRRALSLLVKGATVHVWHGMTRSKRRDVFINSPGDHAHECTWGTYEALARRELLTLREENERYSVYEVNEAGREAYQGGTG